MLEVLNKYPKAAEIIKNYYIKQFLTQLKHFNDEEKELLIKEDQVIALDKVATLIEANPHHLFYLFDEYGIYINITIDIPLEGVFSYTLGEINSTDYSHRKEAEKDAVIEAIIFLNDK